MKDRGASASTGFALVALCCVAVVGALGIAVLPPVGSAALVIALILPVGLMLVALMPNSKRVHYGVIYVVLGVALAVKFLWPSFAYIPIQSLPTKNPQRAIWALAIVYWVYSIATSRELRERFIRRSSHSPIFWTAVFIFFWKVISCFASEDPIYSVRLVFLEMFEYMPAYLFVVTWVRNVGDSGRIAKFLTLTLICVLPIAALEFVRSENVFKPFIPIDPDNPDFIRWALDSKLRGGAYRVQASFNHPLLLAQFAAVMVPVLLIDIRQRMALRQRIWLPVVALLCVPPLIYLTHSRSGYVLLMLAGLGVLLVSVLRSLRSRQKSYRRSTFSILALMLSLGALPIAMAVVIGLSKGNSAEEQGSTDARVEMLEKSMRPVLKTPLFGSGVGVGLLQAAAVSRGSGIVSLDNYYLILALDSGLPVALAFAALLLLAARRLFFATRDQSRRSFYVSMWAMAVILFGTFMTILGTPHNLPLFYACLGMLMVDEADA